MKVWVMEGVVSPRVFASRKVAQEAAEWHAADMGNFKPVVWTENSDEEHRMDYWTDLGPASLWIRKVEVEN